MSMTSRRRLLFNLLPTPVLVKGVLPFSLLWLGSVARVRPELTSLDLRPLREQTTLNSSVGCNCAYCACLFLLFPTRLGELTMVTNFMITRQSHQVWRQLWCRLDNAINLRPSRPHVFLCTCHCHGVSFAWLLQVLWPLARATIVSSSVCPSPTVCVLWSWHGWQNY